MTKIAENSKLPVRLKFAATVAAAALLVSGCSLLEVHGDEEGEAAEASAEDASKPAKSSSVKAGQTILEAAKAKIGMKVSGAIVKDGPSNFFYFANPGKLRDKVRIRLENKSTTYRPQIFVYDENRSKLFNAYDYTNGASLERTLVLDPGQGVYVEVHPLGSEGAYELSAIALKAYDKYEANDDGLTATELKFGNSVEASILDKNDSDWFHITPTTAGKVTIALENLSSTYRPQVFVYDTRKSKIVNKYDYTNGAGLDFNVDIEPGQDFYVQVHPLGTEGKYRLTTRAAVLASDMASALDAEGSISLYGVYFDTDKTFVKPESSNTLAEVAALLKNNPSLKLEVAGHTDNTGTKSHNQELSQGRAEAVVQALVGQHQIDASRLVSKGYGDTKPVADNKTTNGKAKNRRVVLRKL